jgi:hypothetical protein
MARGTGRRLPNLANFPPVAKDWLTGEESSDVVFRKGKWWTSTHYEFVERDKVSDQRRVQRNKAMKTFLRGQSASTGL